MDMYPVNKNLVGWKAAKTKSKKSQPATAQTELARFLQVPLISP
jgi:hypothetical protein